MATSERIIALRSPTTGKLYGEYHHGGEYKSFLRGMYTPGGDNVVATPPPDHPHHHGLQYGLCASDVNFWEEDPRSEPAHRRIGRQTSLSITVLQKEVGIAHELVWRDDELVSFHEQRRITVAQIGGGAAPTAFVWTWRTKLIAARDIALVVSAWPAQGGYCGLGLRLAPEHFLHRSQADFTPAPGGTGSAPAQVRVRGAGAQLTFEQNTEVQRDVLFLMGCDQSPADFAFLSLGPTNSAALGLKQGDVLERAYTIVVSDR